MTIPFLEIFQSKDAGPRGGCQRDLPGNRNETSQYRTAGLPGISSLVYT